MSNKELEVYNIISNIRTLNAQNYSELLSNYEESLVNFVIEKMIDEVDRGTQKFDYYIDRILSYEDNSGIKDVYDAYMDAASSFPTLTPKESVELASSIHEIVSEIENLLSSVEYELVNSPWICDKVDSCIKTCSNLEMVKRIRQLYEKYLNKRNFLLQANLKLVVSYGKHFYKPGADFNDLIQYGNLGFMRAIEKYDPKHDTNLSTYAYQWIKQSITRYMPMLACPTTVPYNLVAMNMSINKAIKVLTNEIGYEPTNEEIANYLELPVNKVEEVRTMFLEAVSLNETAPGPDDSKGDSMFIDVIEDKNASVEEQVFYNQMSSELMEILRSSLNRQEYDIICHRYCLDNCSFMTLEQLGQKYDVSRERIRQIERKIIKTKLKRKCRDFKVYI